MDDGAIEELRRLQARAYAPDGDIQGDDGALRRLGELEELSRAAAFTTPDAVTEASPPPGDPAEDEPAEELPAVAALPEADDPAPTPPRRRLSRRWLALLWPASLVVVAGVVGATAMSVAPRASLSPEANHVETLRLDPDFTWPKFLGDEPGDAVGFRDYFGLTAVAVDGSLWGANASSCFLLMPTEHIAEGAESFNGPIFSGCGAGPFPATVELLVGGELPAALLDRFPEGSALQFVLDGTRIDVYSAPDIEPTES